MLKEVVVEEEAIWMMMGRTMGQIWSALSPKMTLVRIWAQELNRCVADLSSEVVKLLASLVVAVGASLSMTLQALSHKDPKPMTTRFLTILK